jgi:hypothetical protein
MPQSGSIDFCTVPSTSASREPIDAFVRVASVARMIRMPAPDGGSPNGWFDEPGMLRPAA